MLQVLVNMLKSLYGLLYSIMRPMRRLVCRRRRVSEADGSELMSVATGADVKTDLPLYGQAAGAGEEGEMESWDSWSDPTGVSVDQSAPSYPGGGQVNNGTPAFNQPEPEPEFEPDFFQDMAPEVKKQRKYLIRKKEAGFLPNTTSAMMSRMAVMSDVPAASSELGEWQEETNAWDTGEASEDLTWQAEEAIRDTRKKERLERQIGQQKKKLEKEAMRGMRTNPTLIATKLS